MSGTFPGAARHPHARAVLAAGGYTAADHAEGLRFLNAVLAHVQASASPLDDEPARSADAEIQSWVRLNFSRFRGAVLRLHGRGCSLFIGIEAPTPNESVLALATLLERLNALAPDDDVGATVARRGLNAKLRQRLAHLVDRARTLPPQTVNAEDSYEADLLALYRWHADWAGTARSLIRNKNVLAVLGIARKRRRTPVATTDERADDAE